MRTISIILGLLFILLNNVAFAQSPDGLASWGRDSSGDLSVKKIVTENIKFSADLGSSGELYGVSGRPSQRPGSSGRTFFRPSINLFDKVNINFEFFLSTEGNGSRQDINTATFNPEWSWGKLYYGDFTIPVSKFTISDVKVTGYGIDLFPGIFKLVAFSGKSQKAIAADPTSSMYERTIYGGKIGLGDEGGSHFHINFLRAYDNINSLNRNIFKKIDTVTAAGGSRIDTNYVGVTPQENLITDVNWGLHMFNSKLKIKAELAISLYTSDLFSKTVDSKDVPKELGKYYTPRATSSGDFAFSSDISYSGSTVNLKSGYTMVGPGYTSLGLGSVINDKQIIMGGIGLNLFSGNLNIQTTVQKQNDNLAKQKIYTTDRNNISFMVTGRPSSSLSLTLNTNVNTIGNNALNDTLKLDLLSATYGLTGNYSFNAFKLKHVLNMGYNSQLSQSKNIVTGGSKVGATSVTFGVSTDYTEHLNSNIAANFNKVDAGSGGQNSTQAYNGQVNYKMFDNRLNSGFSYSLQNSDASVSHVLMVRASYQIVEQSSITFQTRVTFFNGKGANAFSYKERSSTLDWSYRF